MKRRKKRFRHDLLVIIVTTVVVASLMSVLFMYSALQAAVEKATPTPTVVAIATTPWPTHVPLPIVTSTPTPDPTRTPNPRTVWVEHPTVVPPNVSFFTPWDPSSTLAPTKYDFNAYVISRNGGVSSYSSSSTDDPIYVGNKNTMVFHVESCPYVEFIIIKHKVEFDNRFEALNDGFEPCDYCEP